MNFTFRPQWKEELVCSCQLGEFILEMPMGVPSVYIPTQAAWQDRAPMWARPYWSSVHVQLMDWCTNHGFPLHVDDSANIFSK